MIKLQFYLAVVRLEHLFVNHIAFIMDGNRRWVSAQSFNSLRANGLSAGSETLNLVVAWALEKNIPFLSVYALSIENLQRNDATLEQLYSLINSGSDEMWQKMAQSGVQVRFVGDRTLFSSVVLENIEKVERATVDCAKLKLSILFCYGGQQEIVSAAKKLAERVLSGDLLVSEVDAKAFEKELWNSTVPFPDLIVRTGRHLRLSNFLLYQAAYAELCFLDILWPDLKRDHLDEIFERFSLVERNIGR